MTLACSCPDTDGSDGWYYYAPDDFTHYDRPRRTRCRSCHDWIAAGDCCGKFYRYRGSRHEVEDNIYGEEVPLAPWYLCERCMGLFFSLSDLGFCINLPDDMRELVKEYAREYGR